MRARKTAVKAVHDVLYKDKYSNMVLDAYMNSASLSDSDRRLCTNITMGTLQNSIYIEHLVKPYIKNMKKTDTMVLSIIKCAIYQYVFLDRIPDYAILNISGDLTRQLVGNRQVPFVNAVLRHFTRNFQGHDENLPDHIRWSCTKQAYDAMRTQMSKEQVSKLLQGFNSVSDTYISINTHFFDYDQTLDELKTEGFQTEPVDKNSAIIKGGLSPFTSSAFKKGAIIVQDKGASAIARAVDADLNMTVLDACAAPGGKTVYIANMMKNTGKIVACDVVSSRVASMKENISRCGFDNVECVEKDMTVFDDSFSGKFDRVLIDAPCSGLGVAGKRPEIKLKYVSSDSLIHTQKRLISVCSKYVKPRGFLVYATCTVNRAENRDVIDDFLEGDEYFRIKEEICLNGFYACVIGA